jgi:6-pyruvoyltetrahydropterin/6-carboxytetrahydropterin synthase
MSVFEITKAATFDAAHHFPSEPEGSPYRRIHGHSFQVEATVRSEVLDAEHG